MDPPRAHICCLVDCREWKASTSRLLCTEARCPDCGIPSAAQLAKLAAPLEASLPPRDPALPPNRVSAALAALFRPPKCLQAFAAALRAARLAPAPSAPAVVRTGTLPPARLAKMSFLSDRLGTLKARGITFVRVVGITAAGVAGMDCSAQAEALASTSGTRCEWRCDECSHTWTAAPVQLLGGTRTCPKASGCPYCAPRSNIICEDATCHKCSLRSVASVSVELAERGIAFVKDSDGKPATKLARNSKCRGVSWTCMECHK